MPLNIYDEAAWQTAWRFEPEKKTLPVKAETAIPTKDYTVVAV
jgi:hypothetical protein